MPTRVIRDGILTSEPIAMLGWAEEVFYRRLMSVVDDHGRFYAHPALIRAACYPLQLEKVSDSDIGKWLRCAEKAGLVRVYPASDGKRYIELLKFGQRIQSKSKFPEPCSGAPESTVIHGKEPESTMVHGGSPCITVDHGLVGVGVGVGVEGVSPAKRGRNQRPTKRPLPDGFGISDAVKYWAKRKGYSRLDEHLEAFVAKARANGYAYADWDSAFMEAVRADWAKLGSSPGKTVNHRESPAAMREL